MRIAEMILWKEVKKEIQESREEMSYPCFDYIILLYIKYT